MTLRKTSRTPWLLVLVLPSIIGGCRSREPIGGCPYEDIELSPDSVTPWETTIEQDMAQLMGPFLGTFRWHDGEEVITVPKAGQEIEAEAVVEFDPVTARMRRYESTEQTPVCETDYLFMEATVSFVRLDDGGVELVTPITLRRRNGRVPYIGEAEITPIEAFDPELAPHMDFQIEEIWVRMEWSENGMFSAEYDYFGASDDTASAGHGVSKLVAEFVMSR